MDENSTYELSRDEIAALLEEGARRRLGISALEMVQMYRADTLDDPGAVRDLLALSRLLADNDPLHA